MASKARMVGSTEATQPETAVEEGRGLPRSTREEEIRNRAYGIYLQRGGQPGYELEDWLKAEREQSPNLTGVLLQLLGNTTNPKVLRQLMTPDARYVALTFDNPELKKIMPWVGTHHGPESLSEAFAVIQSFWKTLAFEVTDTIEQGNRVAFFGSFTLQSNATGKEITSPLSVLARFEGDKVAYIRFQEDSYGTAGSLQTRGVTRLHSGPSEKEVEV